MWWDVGIHQPLPSGLKLPTSSLPLKTVGESVESFPEVVRDDSLVSPSQFHTCSPSITAGKLWVKYN